MPEKVMIGFHNGSETFDFVQVDEDNAMVCSCALLKNSHFCLEKVLLDSEI